MKNFVLVLMISLMLATSVEAQTISAYMSLSPSADKVAVSYIKEKTGVTVQFIHLSFEEIEAKLKAEAPHFTSDIIIGCSVGAVLWAEQEQLSVPYVSSGWSGVSDVWADKDGHWYNLANASFVFIGNKNMLAKMGCDLPYSWNDLLHPRWEKQLIVPSPITSGMAHTIRYNILALYGEEGGWEYMKKLDKNVNHYTRGSNAPVEMIGRGEFPVAIASDEQILSRINQGHPIVWTVPKEGTGYQGLYAMILKGTKNLEASKKVIDVLGSKGFQELLATFSYVTARPTTNALYGKNLPKYIKSDMKKAFDDKAKNNDKWKQLFK